MKSTYCLLNLATLTPLFLFWPLAAVADQVTPHFAANYRADYFGVEIHAVRELKKLNHDTMVLRFHTESFFAEIDESSTLTWQPQQTLSLIPLDYRYRHTVFGKNRHIHLTFDWQTRRVVNMLTKSLAPLPENTPVFDKLSYQLQLQYDLLKGLTKFDYWVADGQDLKHYHFQLIGEEMLITAVGSLMAVKVERVRSDSKRTTYIWFAKDWNYLMVQLEQHKNKYEQYRIQLLDATVNGVNVYGK